MSLGRYGFDRVRCQGASVALLAVNHGTATIDALRSPNIPYLAGCLQGIGGGYVGKAQALQTVAET